MNLRLLSLISLIALLTGCAVATPFVAGGAAGHAIGRYEENSKVRAAAALDEEPDLLTYSVEAIARNNTDKAIKVYMMGYNNPDYTQNIKSLAIYQVGLIYMNRFNTDRNDDKALEYFQLHHKEFPQSRLFAKVDQKIKTIQERKKQPAQLTASELLKQVDRSRLLAQPKISFDEELTPMSERAITSERIEDAESVYLILYSNKASSNEMRAKALYQLGLIYMSPYNRHGNNTKAVQYFRKIQQEFPQTKVAKRAQQRVNQVINRQ